MDRFFTDTPISKKYPTYTRANAGEVMPDPCTPMSNTLGIMAAGEAGWRDAYVRLGTFDHEEFEDWTTNCVGQFGGYLFLNMSCTRIYGVRCPGLTPEIVDFQYFGTMPGIPTYEDEARPGDISPVHEARLGEFLQSYVFGRDDLPELREDRDMVDEFVANRPDLASASGADLVGRARSALPMYRKLFDQHIGTSGASGIGIGTVAGVCDAIGHPELTMTLIAGVGDVDSAAPSLFMWDLSRLVASSPSLTAAFDAGASGLLDRLRADGGTDAVKFMTGLEDFLERFGARGPNEWELRSHTWGTKPGLVLAAIDRMRLAGPEADPNRHNHRYREEREQATAVVLQALQGNDEALGQFQGGLRAALLFSAGRERSKTNNIRVVHEIRLALRELGRRAVEQGHLDNVEQIFMLTNEELDDFVADASRFTDVVRQREKEYLELFELEPPFVIYREVPPVSTWKRKSRDGAEQVSSGAVLTGIPGCAGTATGRARVVLDPSDPTALEPGDILVAPVTDPAWTPLFVPAAAVIVDVGAQITHAVIVSRELGIPCVVSVTDATKKIPDGAMITVDGAAGTVTIL
jgi:rifampicin phosphotransferase